MITVNIMIDVHLSKRRGDDIFNIPYIISSIVVVVEAVVKGSIHVDGKDTTPKNLFVE